MNFATGCVEAFVLFGELMSYPSLMQPLIPVDSSESGSEYTGRDSCRCQRFLQQMVLVKQIENRDDDDCPCERQFVFAPFRRRRLLQISGSLYPLECPCSVGRDGVCRDSLFQICLTRYCRQACSSCSCGKSRCPQSSKVTFVGRTLAALPLTIFPCFSG